MKKENLFKTASALLLSGAIAFGGLSIVNAQVNANSFKIGEKFSVSELKMGENAYIIDYKFEDVTGDAIKDNIILVGAKENKDAIYADNQNIVVQDGKTKKYSKATYEGFGGYDGNLFIGDFSGDKTKDVMVAAATGGSGGVVNHLIASFKDNQPSVIFGEKENDGIKIDGKYVDGFKAEINVENINKKISLDVSANKDKYIEMNIYDKSGKILEQIEPYMGPFCLLEPINYNADGVYELKGSQRIAGGWNADTLSFVESRWKYENNKWNVKELQYSTFLLK